jgi:hypothetical protein
MNTSRRGFFSLFAGALAAPVVAKVDLFAGASAPAVSAYMTRAEANAFTADLYRRVLVPRLTAQIYKENPLLSVLKDLA